MQTFAPVYYLVTCGHFDEPYIVERKLSDSSWLETVKDIADVQFENLHSVIETSTGRDVTEEMMRAAMELRIVRGADYSHAFGKLVELIVGTRAARSFLREVA